MDADLVFKIGKMQGCKKKRANKVELNIENDNFIQWDYSNDYCCIKNIKK